MGRIRIRNSESKVLIRACSTARLRVFTGNWLSRAAVKPKVLASSSKGRWAKVARLPGVNKRVAIAETRVLR